MQPSVKILLCPFSTFKSVRGQYEAISDNHSIVLVRQSIFPVRRFGELPADRMFICPREEKLSFAARLERIQVLNHTLQGETRNLNASGFLARVLRHEIDHLKCRVYSQCLTELGALQPQSSGRFGKRACEAVQAALGASHGPEITSSQGCFGSSG